MDVRKNKPTGSDDGANKATYSMGMFDFQRHHNILMNVDSYGFMARRNPAENCKAYYSALKQFWINLKPMIYENKREDIEAKFAEVKNIIANGKVPPNTVDKLEELNERMMELRHDINLGIVVHHEKSEKMREKIALGLG